MSDKRKDGVIITIKGLQLVTKLTAGAGALVLSAVKVGVGILPEDTDPLTLDDIISYKMDGVIADCGYDSETKNGYVVMQLSNDGLENGFVMTEIGLYAVDPDLGEILYAYVDMSDDPNYIMPAENGRHKLVQLKLHVIVGATKEIEASINPAAQITKEVFDREIQKIVTPDWDDTGEVDGIESFTDFMDSFVKGTSIYQFLTNFKAGLKYVLHTGKLVNSGMCETPGEFALDAAFGKTLQDQITGLYSEIPFFDPKKSYIDIKNNLPYTTQGNGILYISGQAKTERLTALEVVIDDIRFRTSTCTTSGNINLPSMTSFMMPVSAGCTIQINGRFDFCEFREAFFYQLSEVR